MTPRRLSRKRRPGSWRPDGVAPAAALAALAAVALAGAPAAAATPVFVDATAAAGLAHVYDGSEAFVVGGGAAVLDCDGDGRLDLFLAGGAGAAQLFRNTTPAATADDAVRPISFEPVAGLGLAPDAAAAIARNVTGAYPLDLDGDATLDLMLLRFGRNVWLRGLGGCRFEDAGARVGLLERADHSAAFAAVWEPAAPGPTLAIGNYVDRSRPLQRVGNCEPSYLLRPEPDASAALGWRYGAPIPLEPAACALSMLFVDWSGGGAAAAIDLRVANDREYFDRGGGEQLFRLTADGVRRLDAADGWEGAAIWGMGLDAADLDGDGRPEIAVTNMADNRLEALIEPEAGRPSFENRAFALNASSQRPYVGRDVRPSTSWHVAFADIDNDGDDDLWIVKGNVGEMPGFAAFDPDSLLLREADGRFREVGFEAGIAQPTEGRGGAVADFDGDGRLDLVVVNRSQPARLYQSMPAGLPQTRAATVDLVQAGPNAFAVGAVLEVTLDAASPSRRTLVRRVGGGHAGGVAAPFHIGLGASPSARIVVVWPDGARSEPIRAVAGDRLLVRRPDRP